MFRVVIPARYASTRFPGKALVSIAGKPMVQWVYERAVASGAREVLIATDDLLIVSAAHSFGAATIMTAASHVSGTDRIAEVARLRGWAESDLVVNVQGDEPLIAPAAIDQVAGALADNPWAAIATVATAVTSLQQLLDTNAVKVVTDTRGRALYFSRAPIPWNRAGAGAAVTTQRLYAGARRHVGLYAYRVGALRRLADLPPSELEKREALEQLRALENGLDIVVVDALEPPGPDVNTPEDLEHVAALLQKDLTECASRR
ncbi:MAG TPA: 3-deoxy-manno-octulosonate cytidylyltransferase [Steroidobacteraceae bacterium]|nr:3-deoxy-manno-octulosonate cytidylyltransferase [Steroidobacteraceae bacterium]